MGTSYFGDGLRRLRSHRGVVIGAYVLFGVATRETNIVLGCIQACCWGFLFGNGRVLEV